MNFLATQTGTLTINAAFLEEIKNDNKELNDRLSAVNNTLSSPRWYRVRGQLLLALLERPGSSLGE